MSDLAERLEKLDRENIKLRKEREDQKNTLDRLNQKIKSLKRSNSKNRKKRETSQRRDESLNKETVSKIKIITMLQQEVGGSDTKIFHTLPINAPFLLEEEKYFLSNMGDMFSNLSKEDNKIAILATKAVARLKTLNKTCKILKNDLSSTSDKAENIEKKYQKAIEEGTESDKRLLQMQREFSAKKYQSNLNATSLSQKNYELEQSNLLMNRKFS